ncbi:MAG: hypothetical protein H8E59_05695 [Actinobacteria bacterium]|nr:hypothetical protein [Actinomycetota bacterium]
MSIERGRDWGSRGPLPEDGVVVASNADLLDLVTRHRRAGSQIPPVALTGGDLWRTLGGAKGVERWRGELGQRLRVDLGTALLDGRLHWFCSHLVARRSWLRGRTWVAANAAHLDTWNIAPRAHPADGLLDVLDADLAVGQRIGAHRRLPGGNHVPHPEIRYTRTRAEQVEFDRPTPIWLDGRRTGTARRLSVRLDGEALLVVI